MSKLFWEREEEVRITFPLRLGSLSQSINFKNLSACMPPSSSMNNTGQTCTCTDTISMSSLNFLTASPHHALRSVSVASLQPKEQSSGAYNIMTRNLSLVCVCTWSPVLLSLVKTNEQINTWLTQLPWGKMKVRVFTYKLHPAGTATFSAADYQFSGIYGNLLSLPINAMCFYCW